MSPITTTITMPMTTIPRKSVKIYKKEVGCSKKMGCWLFKKGEVWLFKKSVVGCSKKGGEKGEGLVVQKKERGCGCLKREGGRGGCL